MQDEINGVEGKQLEEIAGVALEEESPGSESLQVVRTPESDEEMKQLYDHDTECKYFGSRTVYDAENLLNDIQKLGTNQVKKIEFSKLTFKTFNFKK